ncbi:MAG: fumarylacetoacetate hydrolase family protein [Planctomycetota bacterium]
MKQTEPDQMMRWARRQLADYDARNPGTLFGNGIVLDIPTAYKLQALVGQLRRDRDESQVGYKVGCTSPNIRSQLGIDHSIYGRLFGTEQRASGNNLSREQFANLAIEGELAVELAREPSEEDFQQDRLPACVKRVFPVIELHNHVIRSSESTAAELIANNAIHAGFCAGKGCSRTEIVNDIGWEDFALTIFIDNQPLETCGGPELIETIRVSLKWLSDELTAAGQGLSRGHIVLTGSIPPLIPITKDCVVRVDAVQLGCVEAKFLH